LILAWNWKYLAVLICLRSTLPTTFLSSLLNLRGMMEEDGLATVDTDAQVWKE
jgi:hypothetical protein